MLCADSEFDPADSDPAGLGDLRPRVSTPQPAGPGTTGPERCLWRLVFPLNSGFLTPTRMCNWGLLGPDMSRPTSEMSKKHTTLASLCRQVWKIRDWRKIIFICCSPEGLRNFSLCRAFYLLTRGPRASAVMPCLRASLTLSIAKTACGRGGEGKKGASFHENTPISRKGGLLSPTSLGPSFESLTKGRT